MNNFLLPYLLIMAHFISGAIFLSIINRKLDPFESKAQWLKLLVYVLLFNLLWCSAIWFEVLFIFLGSGIMILGAWEGWKTINKVRHTAWIAIGFLLILIGFWDFLHLPKNEILFTLFMVVLFDGSSQITGQLLGRNKLLPGISPKKTVEGLAGGIVITLGTAIFVRTSFSMNWSEFILMSMLILGAAFTGDLLASWLKRKAELKNFGELLPGHGGIMDRYDSLILAGSALSLLGVVKTLVL